MRQRLACFNIGDVKTTVAHLDGIMGIGFPSSIFHLERLFAQLFGSSILTILMVSKLLDTKPFKLLHGFKNLLAISQSCGLSVSGLHREVYPAGP